MSVRDVERTLQAVALHGIFAKYGLLVFCMDDMDHFFLAVRVMADLSVGTTQEEDYTCRADMSDSQFEKEVCVGSYFYFACPCSY